jgi:glutathione S-transferase
MIHDALSPYVLGEKVSAADPYLHMLDAWYPGDLAALHARLPKLVQHSKLLRQRAATVKAEQAHTDG